MTVTTLTVCCCECQKDHSRDVEVLRHVHSSITVHSDMRYVIDGDVQSGHARSDSPSSPELTKVPDSSITSHYSVRRARSPPHSRPNSLSAHLQMGKGSPRLRLSKSSQARFPPPGFPHLRS